MINPEVSVSILSLMDTMGAKLEPKLKLNTLLGITFEKVGVEY